MEDNTQAVQALSKKDEAYVRIKDRIISGEYKPVPFWWNAPSAILST